MRKNMRLAVALAVLVLSAGALAAEEAPVLLERGVYKEETAGDIDAAIEIYSQIVEQHTSDRAVAAEAHLRLARCYIKKGKDAVALDYLEKVIRDFADQETIAAAAEVEAGKLRPRFAGPPKVVKTSPETYSTDVSPSLDRITVTFNRPMMDKSWSWISGGETFPESAGKIHYDSTRTTCTMPVKLEPGKVYCVGVNSPSHKNFKTPDRVPAKWYAVVFSTADRNGKPTPIPENLLARAKSINEAAVSDAGPPKVVSTSPVAYANNVSPSLDRITVTFNRPMMDKSWSWTGGGETSPKGAGKIHYDSTRTTCTRPVKLEPGKVYWVGINSPSHKNFKTPDRIPARRYVILFATAGRDGKPTPIPADWLARAKRINGNQTAPE